MTPSDEALRLAQTPRTESNLRGSDIRPTSPFAEFTRELERELNAIRAECERLQGENDKLLSASEQVHETWTANLLSETARANAAESLAERLRAELETARTALRTLSESKCMNAWGHMIAGDALRATEVPTKEK